VELPGDVRGAPVAGDGVVEGERRMALEPVALRVHVDHCGEPRVRDGAVVALEVVLRRDLPVRPHGVLHAVVEGEGVHVEPARGDDRRQLAERVGQRRGVRVGVHEQERAPRADGRRPQAELRRVERAVRPRRGAQRAVEAVRPGVVVALQRGAPPGPRDDLRAAVPTHVGERAQRRAGLARAHDDDRDVAPRGT
jgi:hypothetical protein